MSSKRKDHRSFLLGPSVTPDDSDIKGLKLPSKSQVIRSFIAIKEEMEIYIELSSQDLMKITEPRRNSGAPMQRIEKFIYELESTLSFLA